MKTSSSTVILLLFLTAIPAAVPAQWTDGRKANAVLGQPNFTAQLAGTSATRMATPRDVAVDPGTGKIFVADSFNNRVLRFSSAAAMAKGAAAEAVFGQPSFDLNFVAMSEQNRLNFPYGVFVDLQGRLWVADTQNNRVLRFDNASTMGNEPDADMVLGQANFTDNMAATTQTGMNFPTDIVVDTLGTLWVADQGNNRVLKFANVLAKANGDPADGVLGQQNFTSDAAGTTSMTMDSPSGVGARGIRMGLSVTVELWVGDSSNNRVLRFDEANGMANGAAADGVLGQTVFTTKNSGTTRETFNNPGRLAVRGTDLWVSDTINSRVLRFADLDSLPDGAPATNVLGKANFTTDGEIHTQTSLGAPSGLSTDEEGNLFVAENEAPRVVRFSPGDAQPDNHTGKRRGKEKGDGIYNLSAAGQKIRVQKSGSRGRVHFTIQNDGPFDDVFQTRATKGNRKVEVGYFALGEGRKNITGQIGRGKYNAAVEYRSKLAILAKVKADGRGRRNLTLLSRSVDNGAGDKVKARVILGR